MGRSGPWDFGWEGRGDKVPAGETGLHAVRAFFGGGLWGAPKFLLLGSQREEHLSSGSQPRGGSSTPGALTPTLFIGPNFSIRLWGGQARRQGPLCAWSQSSQQAQRTTSCRAVAGGKGRRPRRWERDTAGAHRSASRQGSRSLCVC